MSGTRGEVLARSIVAKLDAHQQLNEEVLRRLVGLVSEAMMDINEGLDQGLVKLEQDISSRYVASSVAQLEGFSVGACWGALEALRAFAEASSEFDTMSQCVDVARRYRELFETVHERPGIAQGQLAAILGEKKSNFSQKLARLEKYRMLTVNIIGRSKYLYLTRRGEDALQQVLAKTGGQRTRELMSNKTVRAVSAAEIAFDENGLVNSYHREFYVTMTRNENAREAAIVNDKQERYFRPGTQRSLENRADAQMSEHVSNWKGRDKDWLSIAMPYAISR